MSFQRTARELPIWPPRKPALGIQVPIILLAAGCLLVGWQAAGIVHGLIRAMATASSGVRAPAYDMGQLHHVGTAFYMSLAALIGGLILYALRERLFELYDQLPPADAREIFEWLMTRAGNGARSGLFTPWKMDRSSAISR